ncbi:T-cell ecto-ADP-ribosyltransferase 1 [Oryzias melastigma]|uniref:NAD(P)(+)--arginine ADP-ribosyltransferase n=1 Tax=Oryzias melastigma TaxID=30732 RepID=A0A834CD55_ORYME|nr:T-cell ecto-ADP-ribosyltransferase 1 [Oryzias melastigma]
MERRDAVETTEMLPDKLEAPRLFGNTNDMKLVNGPACRLGILRKWAVFSTAALVVLLLLNDPFLILWWPQRPMEKAEVMVLPLDMAADSIDDMYAGCRSETAALIDLFGVFEWNYNGNFSLAWAFAEKHANKPAHVRLKDDHAIVHTLRRHQAPCRTTYLRTWKHFDQNVARTNVRFGHFIWAASSSLSFELQGNVSCFEIYTCFGADITDYSSVEQQGQVLIPTYEVFTITKVLKHEPWCGVVYRLESTRVPRADQNCKLTEELSGTFLEAARRVWLGCSAAKLSVCAVLLAVCSVVLVRGKQTCFVAAVLGALLLLLVGVLVLS